MTTFYDCWYAYVDGHLVNTVTPKRNTSVWGRLCWFSDFDAESLSPTQVERYVAHRTAQGAKPGTINREFSLLRGCLNWAEKEGMIRRASHIKGLPKPSPKMTVLTHEQAVRVVKVADEGTNWRPKVFVRLALGTGQRPGALVELRWDQVDLRNGVIDFRTPDRRKKKRAIVPINDMVKHALRIAEANRESDYVISRYGRRLATAQQLVRYLAKKARIKDLTPHVFRHTVASLLLQGGEDLLRVSKLLGHSSTVVTEQVYFKHPPSWLKATTSKLRF